MCHLFCYEIVDIGEKMIKRAFKIVWRFFTNPYMRFQYFTKIGFYRKLSDEEWLKKWYYLKTNQELDLTSPKTFNEKMQWYKVNYHNDLLTQTADKHAVREYVKQIGLDYLLKKEYGVYKNANEINLTELPNEFFLKTNHGSGRNLIVRKSQLSPKEWKSVKRYFDKQLQKNYYWDYREWAYKNIAPQIICEELLLPKEGEELIDLNFFCFGGKVKLVYYNKGLSDNRGRHRNGERAVFDRNMKYIKAAKTQLTCLEEQDCLIPPNIEKVIADAEKLAEPFPFVRVDFIFVNEQIYFGELTFYSAAGVMRLEPSYLMEDMGNWFDISAINSEK